MFGLLRRLSDASEGALALVSGRPLHELDVMFTPHRFPVAAQHGVMFADSPATALHGAQIVLSLVSADAALTAARDYAPFLSPGALWCDMNSVAPDTKRAAAAFIDAAGGSIVRDRVEYEVPLGLLGELARVVFVERQLGASFDFRRESIRKLFGAESGPRSSVLSSANHGVSDDHRQFVR